MKMYRRLAPVPLPWLPRNAPPTALFAGMCWVCLNRARRLGGAASRASALYPACGAVLRVPRGGAAFAISGVLPANPCRPQAATLRTCTRGRRCSTASTPVQTRRKHVAAALPAFADEVLNKLLVPAAKTFGALLVVLFFIQRKLIFFPPADIVDPRDQGGSPKLVLMPSGNGSQKHAAAFFNSRSSGGPVLVYFHGNADQVGWGGSFVGNHFQSRYGLRLFAVEYPGYGLATPGSPSEDTIYAAAEELLLYLENDLGVPRSEMVLFGQSIGCGAALEMAKRGFGGRVVLLSPFTSLLDMAKTWYPFLTPALRILPWLVRDKFDNCSKARGVTMPVLVVHGQEDEIVPSSMGRELANTIGQSAQLKLVPGMGHNDVFERDEVLDAIASFARLHESPQV